MTLGGRRGRRAAVGAGLTGLVAGLLAMVPVVSSAAVDDGSIGGTVSGVDGSTPPLMEVEACSWDEAGGTCGEPRFVASPDDAGSYRIDGLPAGDYKVEFSSGDAAYAPEWYDDRPDAGSAAVVTVASAEDVVGIDALLGPGSAPNDPPPIEFTTPPSITGGKRVGRTLTADPGATSPAGAAFGYQWLRAGSPITGATRRTHRLTPADLRHRIAVEVTASRDGWGPATTRSAATRTIRKGRMTIANRPRVKGLAKVGRTLRARPMTGSVSPSPKGVTIHWLVNDSEITKRRNDRRFPVRPWMRGKKLRVRFLYRPPAGYQRLKRVVGKGRIRPEGTPVSYPAAAPKPTFTAPNRRAVGGGPNARTARLSDQVWRSMRGRSWHRGCPVGRSQLRLVSINYWDYRGDRRRGTIVVHRAIAGRAAGALADMYRGQYPIRRMHRVDRFGWSKRLQGANDYKSMRAGNTSAFNCRSVVGRPGVRSPHSYGRAIDVNPWENPYYSQQDGWVPNRWWVSRSHPRIAWRSIQHPVLRIWRSHGFRWTYGRSDAHHVDGRIAPNQGAGSFVAR